MVTSMMNPAAASEPFGLAYIKTLAGGIGLKVCVGSTAGIASFRWSCFIPYIIDVAASSQRPVVLVCVTCGSF